MVELARLRLVDRQHVQILLELLRFLLKAQVLLDRNHAVAFLILLFFYLLEVPRWQDSRLLLLLQLLLRRLRLVGWPGVGAELRQ